VNTIHRASRLFSAKKLTKDRFRWAACQIDVLEDCLDYPLLKKALASLPTTLDETYRRILDTISDEHKSYAVRILQFLTFSERPLSIEEIVDAIAVNTDGDPYFKKHQLWAHPARLLQRLWHPKTTRIQPSVLQLLLLSVSTASRLIGVACSLVQASCSP
jgi:hypothetical protein